MSKPGARPFIAAYDKRKPNPTGKFMIFHENHKTY